MTKLNIPTLQSGEWCPVTQLTSSCLESYFQKYYILYMHYAYGYIYRNNTKTVSDVIKIPLCPNLSREAS